VIYCIPGGYRVGCVLSVPVTTEIGIISHKGIMTEKLGDDGLPMVLHNAKLFDQIIESSMTVFVLKARGLVRSEGYPGLFAPGIVLERARSQLGKPWRPWDNCEHFVAWAHGLERVSPELRRKVKKAGVVTGVAVAGFFACKFLL